MHPSGLGKRYDSNMLDFTSTNDSGLNGSSSRQNSSPHGALDDIHVPVLIVGGGPTGLFTAYMLSKLGSE